MSATDIITNHFDKAGIPIIDMETRRFPGETIIVVRVATDAVAAASELSNRIDRELAANGFEGFVAIRAAESGTGALGKKSVHGLTDPRVAELITLLTSRSRTSEIQPSLSYVRDKSENVSRVITPRHHLIFGRRGAGKTALMVEAKKMLSEQGSLTAWLNLQTYRRSTTAQTFLAAADRLCEQVQLFYETKRAPAVVAEAAKLRDVFTQLSSRATLGDDEVLTLIPQMQNMLRRFGQTAAVRIFLFLDDFHYFARDLQPALLDMIHGVIRDTDVWLKIAGIKHLSNWFQPHPPLGLQTGQDADHIDLDVTLENPLEAKKFLETVLRSYAEHVGIKPLSSILSSQSLDRLVLASGAVPRDYLVLTASALGQAKKRGNALAVGVQDINRVAGNAAKAKLSELEDDAASTGQLTSKILQGLQTLREFCIDEKNSTYFRVDFRDKENYSTQYSILEELLDLRLIHLVDGSLSDEREAGRRSEVYMIDLSQFSGQRLKRKLRVLDFEAGYLVLKQTGTSLAPKIGNTPNARLGILRRGPLFSLQLLNGAADGARSAAD
jgi:hypothetical protein